MITTNIVFDRKGKASNKKPGTIEILVTVNRKNQYVSTGIRILKSEWKYGQIVNRPDCLELMERLIAIKRKIEVGVTKAIEQGQEINLKAIRDGITEMPRYEAMFDWMYAEISSMNIKQGTRNHYNSLMVRLNDFSVIKEWSDVSVENILLFDNWLHKLTNPQTQALISDSGVHNYHKCLKSLFERAFTIGKLQENPYSRLKGKFKRGDKENIEYLTEEEMQRIENLEIDSRIYREARDLFIVQMYTGLSYSDMVALNPSEYKLVDGKYIQRTERIKSGVPFINQLLPPVISVLERYDWKLPYINNAEYNERLKVIGRLAEISIPLHSHLGRHTFATYMLSNGVPIEHVSKMLGHTNITQTQRYAKVLAMDVRASFDKISTKLNNK